MPAWLKLVESSYSTFDTFPSASKLFFLEITIGCRSFQTSILIASSLIHALNLGTRFLVVEENCDARILSYNNPPLMVPHNHITVANPHLIQITVHVQTQIQSQKFKFAKHESSNVQSVANNPWIFVMLEPTSFGFPKCPWKLFCGPAAFKIGLFNF